jgi:hypothetical protein
MNGRVYDPVAGRFLGADPIIDGVSSSQGPNPYAYVHNNPLTLIDPSGYGGCSSIEPHFCPAHFDFGTNSWEILRDWVRDLESSQGGGSAINPSGLPGGERSTIGPGKDRAASFFGGPGVMYGAASTVGGPSNLADTQSATFRNTGIPQDLVDFAVATLLELQQGLPLEIAFAIYRNDSGAIVRGPLVTSPISNPFETKIPIDPSLGILVGVAHTHPYFGSDAILRQLNGRFGLDLDPDHNAANRAGRRFGPEDDDVVRERRIPNIMRTPSSTQIKMMYLDHRGRLRQTIVWSQ